MTSAALGVQPANDICSSTSEYGGPSRQPGTDISYSQNASKSQKSYTLKEAYLFDRHREMGISSEPNQELVSDMEYLKDQKQFNKRHFNRKECCRFIPIPGQCGNGKSCKAKELQCHCGEILSMHAMYGQSQENDLFVPEEYASIIINPEDKLTDVLLEPAVGWHPKTCFTKSITNAFGKIDFNIEQVGAKKPAKYIRLSSDDSVDKCLEMMKTFWNIMEPEPPNLVISVVGGAKNFKLGARSRSIFSTGLIKASKTAKAWLITSGFNTGVMKIVGQAVHEGQTFQWNDDRMSHLIRCIGIAPWGYVKDRHCLESDDELGTFNAHYCSSYPIVHNQPVPLNPDHTHFIFVDDGYRGRYEGVAQFRSEFEKRITQDKEGGLGIPVVLILVEGGIDAIKDVRASLSQEIPVVVCAGTGRAADILAYAYSHTITTSDKRIMSDNNKNSLKQKIAKAYKKDGVELEKLTTDVIMSCQREDLMIICNIKKHEELDLAILSVLLKAKTNSSRESQLKLAMIRKRADIAQEEIIKEDTDWKKAKTKSQLKLAMIWNRADIAQEKIFTEDTDWEKEILENFLTEALVDSKVEFIKLLLNSGIIMHKYLTTERLEALYNSIPQHFYLYQILEASTGSKNKSFKMQDIHNFLQKMLDRYDYDEMAGELKEHKLFKEPYKQLLIWAVLMNRNELAHLFLELGEEPIISALICTALCLGMEKKLPKYMSVIKNNFHEMKDEFEKFAISVLDECHNMDPDKAIMLVEKKSPTWSNLTCLQIAASASDQAFVSSVASQNSINNIWKSGILSSWPKVFLCALFPPAVLLFVEMSLMGKKIMSKKQKILTFYTAPITKFSLYTVAYVGFLILFTYMLSVDYKDVPSATEWISIIWIFSFFVGKIHAFIVFPSPTFSGKLRDYFGILERLEFVNLILALCAFCVRWNHVFEGKIIYCMNAVIFYITIMKVYTANGKLGPKIYMIKRMLRELGLFIMVLAVFLLAYGVASQGLLYRNRSKSWRILKDIIYFPYWQLFGEIFLEELETDETCTLALQASLSGKLTDAENTCRTFHWLVPILLALYLLIGNVLLLNLLVAIFSHVFETVEENAIEIWKFQMYFLVMEFQRHPLLIPPLNIFLHLWHLIVLIYHKHFCIKIKTEQFIKHNLVYLSLFEKEMLANKLRSAKADNIYSLDMRFHALQNRIDELTKIIEDEVLSNIPKVSNENRQEAESGGRHKHDKKKAIKNGIRCETPSMGGMNEQNQLNTLIPEKNKLSDNVIVTSDEANLPFEKADSALPGSSLMSRGNNLAENYTLVSDNLISSSRDKFKLSKSLGNYVDGSNDDLTPIEINSSLKDPENSVSRISTRLTGRALDDNMADASIDSEFLAEEKK